MSDSRPSNEPLSQLISHLQWCIDMKSDPAIGREVDPAVTARELLPLALELQDLRKIATRHDEELEAVTEVTTDEPDVLRDAERYRWLRNFANFSHVDDLLNRVDVTSLDQAIDVARASVTKGEAL